MFLVYLSDWLSFLLRFLHVIVGIAWIGSSFYFNWLENKLQRQHQRKGIAGSLWAVHGGGYYYVEKYQSYPDKQPENLHWFKWEAYITWLSGFSLLVFLYYLNADLYLLSSSSLITLSPTYAVVVSALGLVGGWLIYDGMCRLGVPRYPLVFVAILFALVLVFTYLYSLVFLPKAVLIQIGSMMGTIMVANVFFVIIPMQKKLVKACDKQIEVSPRFRLKGYYRSRHNNYFTLPVIAMMISGHYPHLYSNNHFYWTVLAVVIIAVLIRHIFNLRGKGKTFRKEVSLVSILIIGLIVIMAPTQQLKQDNTPIDFSQVRQVINQRCVSCHSSKPSQVGFAYPPLGLMLNNDVWIKKNREKIYQYAVRSKVMPPKNITNMTDGERHILQLWYQNNVGK